jgi:hypothetical protein
MWGAPLRVEKGRYERKAVHERTCLYCFTINILPLAFLIDHLNTLKFILSCYIIEHLAQCLNTFGHCLIYAGFQPISPAIASFGVYLPTPLDYQLMAKAVAKSASRALGLLIVKIKIHGSFQHNIFSKLYDTMVLVSYKLWILHNS